MFFPLQLGQFGDVDLLSGVIMGRQRNIALFVGGPKIGDVSLIEIGQLVAGDCFLTNGVQQVNKMLIGLAVNVRQFDAHVGCFAQGAAPEKVTRLVIIAEQYPVFIPNYGRQLLHIADHQQLYPAKGLIGVTVTPEYLVDTV